ncbi:hypothetical protein [Streptomyces sp. NPDC089919]|uniref:hypothetical protein n=1 Tax=Streptomyces sp. NPDC089919 TaxID=3155188 RepID=UPI003426D533
MRRRIVAGVITGALGLSLGLLPAVSASATDGWRRCDDRHVTDWRWWDHCCNRDWNDRPSWCWDDVSSQSDPAWNHHDHGNDNHWNDGHWNDHRNGNGNWNGDDRGNGRGDGGGPRDGR